MRQNIIKDSTSNTFESMKLIKTLLVFISYLLYSNVISVVFSTFKVTNTTMISFLADLIFLVCIIFVYKDNLKNDFENLKKDYKISNIIKTVIIWVVIIFVSTIVAYIIIVNKVKTNWFSTFGYYLIVQIGIIIGYFVIREGDENIIDVMLYSSYTVIIVVIIIAIIIGGADSLDLDVPVNGEGKKKKKNV